ncbi:MAG: LicD family protein [Lachnospiraceae bacterium]|nr:LicD family protein [Lachnospiraceae bacterium]
MRPISLNEQKKLELDMLLFVDKVCRRHHIEYSICGGTMLGAVRHQGFIPWDDDIDIFLIRPEYEKLIHILRMQQEYYLISEDVEGYLYTHSKLINKDTKMVTNLIGEDYIPGLGVFIDIFPIDGVPGDSNQQKEFVKSMNRNLEQLRRIGKKSYYASDKLWKAFMKRILYYPDHKKAMKLGSQEEQKKKLLQSSRQYPFEDSKYAGFILSIYREKEIMPVEVFQETIDIEFEGYYVRCLKHYDTWLKNIYGDYMRLPPARKRKSHHPYKPYWKDEGDE